ncbi:hypothetical protein [Allochromatium vinosum]|uniref:Uncharacterized protein n=1 Tax=Allochromatium vinosum (strain ATCC 17899 / DSM 180 / NBRC 103801 / NCIMB 10441 / D) TaxID=572477 RepID=D3RSQ2_ALLVD|nr:hypothetical protein [Allochromatium vinosum]ADC62211.1 conserved hypothetical protein [Allochromatium vinosum DSM 180]
MLNTAGLSLDQAPPIRVPFSFFLAAPFFVFLAGALLLWQGESALLTRWSPSALALTHLIALGFLTQVMLGALFQMLPVLIGARVPGANWIAPLVQGCLILGTLALAVGLQWGGAVWLSLGGGALAIGLAAFMGAAGIALVHGRGALRTLQAMRLALFGLLMTLLLGVWLVAGLVGVPVDGLTAWVDLHLGWALLGWVGMLILGVGYQVVPMFHVTPAYPAWLARPAAWVILSGLLLATAATLMGWGGLAVWGFGSAVGVLAVFALVTLDRQRQRERPRIDVTLLYWWSAMLSALLAAVVWLSGGRAELVGVLVLIGVGLGLPSGMLFKIMPFLSWFHLQHRQVAARRFDVRLPHMQAFIPERWARVQFGLHLSALLALTLATTWPETVWLTPLGALMMMSAAALLSWLQLGCYRRHLQIGRRFLTSCAR